MVKTDVKFLTKVTVLLYKTLRVVYLKESYWRFCVWSYKIACLLLYFILVLQLSDVTEQFLQQCSSSAESADRLLSSIDESLNLSRALMRYWSNSCICMDDQPHYTLHSLVIDMFKLQLLDHWPFLHIRVYIQHVYSRTLTTCLWMSIIQTVELTVLSEYFDSTVVKQRMHE